MATFRIGANTDPEIIRRPPPQFAHLRSVYCPIAVHVGNLVFPHPAWCDFAGRLLLRWCQEVWRLAAGESRAARLIFFDTPSEIWLRRTPARWWKATCVIRERDTKKFKEEILCIPEQVEAALLSASQRFLAGVRIAGVWSEDCAELEEFLSQQKASAN